MKEELMILNGEPKWIFKNGKIPKAFDEEIEFSDYMLKKWSRTNRRGIDREPQYVAIHVKGTKAIWVIGEVDIKNSDLQNGEIAWTGEPIVVYTPTKFGKFTLQGNKYTTFKKLITYKSAKDL